MRVSLTSAGDSLADFFEGLLPERGSNWLAGLRTQQQPVSWVIFTSAKYSSKQPDIVSALTGKRGISIQVFVIK